MEEYFKKINCKDKDFYNQYVDKYNGEIVDLFENESNGDGNLFLRKLINSLEIFMEKSKSAILDFKGSLEDRNNNLETGFQHVFNMLVEKISSIENKIILNNFDHIIKIITSISKHPDTNFKYESISQIVKFLVSNEITQTLNANQLSTLTNSMKIKLDLKYNKIDENDEETYNILIQKNRLNDEICRTWRCCLENYFESFSEDDYIKKIGIFQNYYE